MNMAHTPASKIQFIVGHEAFQKEVLESKEPVLVDFYAEWCGPCKLAEPIMEKLSVEYDGRFKIVEIDVDQAENRDITMQYGVRSIPTVFSMVNGKVQTKNIGFIGEDGYRSMITEALDAAA
jgi:thioredoxin 1